jgi:hypothetical protein
MKRGIHQPLTCCLLAPAHKALFRWFILTMVQMHLRLRYSWILAKGITDEGLPVTFFRPALPI